MDWLIDWGLGTSQTFTWWTLMTSSPKPRDDSIITFHFTNKEPRESGVIIPTSQVKMPREGSVIAPTSQEASNSLKLTWLFIRDHTQFEHCCRHLNVHESWNHASPSMGPTTQQDFINICCLKYHQTLPRASQKSFHKCHHLNNTEVQN